MKKNEREKMIEKKSNDNDFTVGSVQKKLVKFTVPIICGNLLMQFYNYTDSVIVGRFIGKEALAAVGASTPFVFMIVSLVIGISMGTTIVVAQFFGKKDFDSIKKASDSLYIFLIITAITMTLLGLLFSRHIMELISLPDDVIPYAVSYLNIFLLGLIFLFIFNSLAAILRGVGDSKSPLIFLAFSTVVNIILDLLFVVLFKWGIEGAAWATVISQFLAVTFALIFISRRNKIVSINFFKLKFDKKIFSKSIKIGIPAGLQQLFTSVGMLAILSIVNGFGTDTIAGYAAASRIEAFIFVIPMNLSIAITSFTAQNFGANLIDRVKDGVKVSLKLSLIASFVVLITLSALSQPLMRMFTDEIEVINVGVGYLYVLGISFFFFDMMFCFMGALRGMGNTIIPMFITLFSLWLIRIPLATVLSSGFLAEMGIWISAALSWALGATAAWFFYHKTIKNL